MKLHVTIQDKDNNVMFKQFVESKKSDIISFAKSHALAHKFYISGYSNKRGSWIEAYNKSGQLINSVK